MVLQILCPIAAGFVREMDAKHIGIGTKLRLQRAGLVAHDAVDIQILVLILMQELFLHLV